MDATTVDHHALTWICRSSLHDAAPYIREANRPTCESALKYFKSKKLGVTYRKLLTARLAKLTKEGV